MGKGQMRWEKASPRARSATHTRSAEEASKGESVTSAAPASHWGRAARTKQYGMWHGMAWHGMAWHGVAWRGMAWHGMAWHGMAGMAWHGMAWHGMAWHGMAWHGMVWYVMVWYSIR